jgi:hypothetical protein
LNLEQIIYLEPSEDILSIRDRVDMAEAKRVLLVVPPYSDVLARRVDLQLIQRRAAQAGLDLALVSGDSLVRSQAREVGLPVFDSVEAGKRRKRWRSPRDEEEPLAQRRSEEAWQAAAQRGPRQVFANRFRLVRLGLAWLIFFAVMAVFAASAVLLVPSAQITLIPASQAVIVELNAVIDPNIQTVDYARSRIPATTVYAEIEGNAQIATSGQKDIPSSRATGKVVFVNQLSQPIRIPQGTAVRTSAFGTAIRFVTMAEAEVPGVFGAQVEVPIEAVDVGVGGNVAANLINEVEGVAGLAVRVSNPQPTSGGGVRQSPAVTQADRDRLRAALLEQLQQRALAQLQSTLGEQEYIPPESLAVAEVLDETYDRFVGEEAPSLGLQMRVRVTALKLGVQDANALVYAAMAAKTPPGHELIPNGLSFQRVETLVPADKRGDLTLVMRGSGFAAARLDSGAVRKAVTGKSVEAADVYLSQALPLQSDPQVEIWPSWFGRMPFLSFRIEIQVKPQR